MSGGRLKLAFISLTAFACLLAANPARADQQHHKKAHVKQPQPTVQPVPVPAPPPAPLTLQQQPASPSQVTFQNGQLTITAPNSVLGEILRAVRSRTGASVDVPPNATERVVGRFGPGPARDVLAALLNGSHFNYVMLGSATNPAVLDRVILISKSGEAEPAAPVSQASATGPQPPPAPMPAGEVASAEPSMTDDEDPSQQDQQAEDEQAQEDAQQQQQTNPPPGIRTPEQLLQEMQQRQQQAQQQQQQQGGNPQPYPTPPGVAPPGVPFQPQPQP
jgi:hypothetical protein